MYPNCNTKNCVFSQFTATPPCSLVLAREHVNFPKILEKKPQYLMNTLLMPTVLPILLHESNIKKTSRCAPCIRFADTQYKVVSQLES